MFRSSLVFLFLIGSSTYAWTTTPSSRRNVMSTLASGLVLGPVAAQALEACPPGANNCVRTSWTPPSGTSKKDAVLVFRAVLESYPNQGLENGKVDGGGYTIVEDALDSAGTARVEFMSSGKGNFAKFLNGGKPFTDDLNVEVNDNGTIDLRSASRVGDSDLGVNAKRVAFLENAVKAMGWSV